MARKQKLFEGQGLDKRQARRARRKRAKWLRERHYIVIFHDTPSRWEYI